jgi:hypothetical protein
LDQNNYAVTSPRQPAYNCIAWAAGDDTRFWWPGTGYWPDGVNEAETLDAFIAAYATLKYKVCKDGKKEKGFEKIAIYINPGNGKPTHAARQLGDGRWTSKLGNEWDIGHDAPELLHSQVYGIVTTYMKRKVKSK